MPWIRLPVGLPSLVQPGRGSALSKRSEQSVVLDATQQLTHRCVAALLPERAPALRRGTGRSQDDRQVWRKNEHVTTGRSARRPRGPGKGPCLKGEASPVELIVIVLTRLSSGCPLQAIVHAYDRDCRTVARGPKQAGNHCQKVPEERVMQK